MLNRDYSTWRIGGRELTLARPRVMGILNVTPDSFSDGGSYADADAAVERGMRMLDEGADLVDVGGESTRPGFEPVDAEEEARRVVPVVRALVAEGAPVSIDTRHAEVARMCVRLGASVVNDVTGFTDQRMIDLAAETDVGCVVMHAGLVAPSARRRSVTLDSSAEAREAEARRRAAAEAEAAGEAAEDDEAEGGEEGRGQDARDAIPADERAALDQLEAVMERTARGISEPTVRLAGARRYTLPDDGPIMRQVMGFLADRARTLMRAGVDQRRICVDPGAGFGKQVAEDLVIQRATAQMASMGYPLMCAVSRKRVTGALSGTDVDERDEATFGMALAAAEAGARVLRVHDVRGMVRALDAYWGVAHPNPRRAFVGLGSNVGDRLGYLLRAVRLIDEVPLTAVTGVSAAYESEPAYGIATPVANCVVELRTELDPLVLLDALLGVEDRLGRTRREGSDVPGPRTIDCDLLWMDGEVHSGRRLTLPHPGLGERHFVLEPLEDLMRGAARFLSHHGVEVADEGDRVGAIRRELGELPWR